MKLNCKRAVTLIELLICLILIGMVMMGLYGIYLFSNYHLVGTDHRIKLQNEATYVLEHMSKKLSQAIGDKGSTANTAVTKYSYLTNGRGIRARIDSSAPFGQINTADLFVDYYLSGTEIRYYANVSAGSAKPPTGSNFIVLTSHAVNNTGLDFPEGFTDITLKNNAFTIAVDLRWIPTANATSDNPNLEMSTSVFMPAVAIN